MKITRRHLRRIIREEKRRMRENCGDMAAPAGGEIVAVEMENPLVESATPEQDLMVEMEVAQRALEQVVESVQNAAVLCPECTQEVAVQAPLMEAMVHQAEALQEMLDAQAEVVAESATIDFTGDVETMPGEEAFAVGYSAGSEGL